MNYYRYRIRSLLSRLEIPIDSLTEALRKLFEYCDEKSDFYSDLALGGGIVGGGAWLAQMTNPVGWFLITFGGINFALTSRMWDNWADEVFSFLDFIERLC